MILEFRSPRLAGGHQIAIVLVIDDTAHVETASRAQNVGRNTRAALGADGQILGL